MSTWRHRALELFPDLRKELEADDASIYSVFWELSPRCRAAHERNDVDELTKIYGFAEWCFRQKTKDLWNAAGVSFYEHLGESPVTRNAMPKWVKPDIFADVKGLLQRVMSADEFEELCRTYGNRRMGPA